MRGHHVRDTAKTVTFSLMLILKAPETVHKRVTVSVAPQHYTEGQFIFYGNFAVEAACYML